MSEHLCPRRQEAPFKVPGAGEHDRWYEDGTCSYCGSLNPDTFMARLEAGDARLGPTDKNYKVYVSNDGGEPFKQTYRDCPRDSTCTGPDDCTHWVTREIGHAKFYFQHLSPEQRTRFVELFNERKVKLDYPGYFYVMPFFVKKSPA